MAPCIYSKEAGRSNENNRKVRRQAKGVCDKYGDGDSVIQETTEGVIEGNSGKANDAPRRPKQRAHTVPSCSVSAGQAVGVKTATSVKRGVVACELALTPRFGLLLYLAIDASTLSSLSTRLLRSVYHAMGATHCC